jgi:hypothetical protein
MRSLPIYRPGLNRTGTTFPIVRFIASHRQQIRLHRLSFDMKYFRHRRQSTRWSGFGATLLKAIVFRHVFYFIIQSVIFLIVHRGPYRQWISPHPFQLPRRMSR